MYKYYFSFLAIVITFIAFLPYIQSILKNETKPHVFSWVIWGTTTFIVFLAQVDDNAGVGAIPIGVSGVVTIFIAVLAYLKKADNSITKVDWAFFVVALMSLPFWYITDNPLWAVVILTGIDVIGFGPTFRKAYSHPFEENISFFVLFIVRNIMVLIALEHYSLTTILFPGVVSVVCLLLLAMIFYRRSSLL